MTHSLPLTEYTLIDCETNLIYGPYETLKEAIHQAHEHELKDWEIHNSVGAIVDWGKRR